MSGLVHESRASGIAGWPLPVRIPLQFESALFIAVGGMDLLITYMLLSGTWNEQIIYTESNPLASYFLYSWGYFGLVMFKLAFMSVAWAACQLIARERLMLGRRVINLCTVIVAVVVVYSICLMMLSSGG